MLIHPWDAATGPAEWQDWLTSTGRFGILAVNNLDPARAPLILPTHFTLVGNELLIHLARPNPVWPHLEAAAEVRLVVTGDYAYIPTYWRTVVDDPQGKAEILTAQLADFQPEGRHATVAASTAPYGRMLPGIRGVRLAVLQVDAKFKYHDHNPIEHRQRVIGHLEQRSHGLDAGAAAQQRRRLAAIGDWQTHRDQP
jgi:transcriptional regulator